MSDNEADERKFEGSSWPSFAEKILNHLPKKVRYAIAYLVVLGLVLYGSLYLYNSFQSARQNTTEATNSLNCEFYTVTGTLTEVSSKIIDWRLVTIKIGAAESLEVTENGNFLINQVYLDQKYPYKKLSVLYNGEPMYTRNISIRTADAIPGTCTISVDRVKLEPSHLEDGTTKNKAEEKLFQSNIADQLFLTELSKQTGYQYSFSSKLHINITFSGSVEQISEGLYYYDGGHLIIKINDIKCKELFELKIGRTLPSGNNHQFVLQRLDQEVNNYVRSNCKWIAKQISECLQL